MGYKTVLRDIGFSQGEVEIYLSLLKLGQATVTVLSQQTGLHRTNIYDTLEKLREKGFVGTHLEGKKRFFTGVEPDSLLAFIKEKESYVEKILPELNNLKNQSADKVTVDVFKGKEGLKVVLRQLLQKKDVVYGYSISGELRKYLPRFSEYYFREQNKRKILHKFIYTNKTKKPKSKFYQIKYLPEEFKSSTTNFSQENVVLNIIWKPEIIIIKITSDKVAENFKKHFELLWKIAKTKK